MSLPETFATAALWLVVLRLVVAVGIPNAAAFTRRSDATEETVTLFLIGLLAGACIFLLARYRRTLPGPLVVLVWTVLMAVSFIIFGWAFLIYSLSTERLNELLGFFSYAVVSIGIGSAICSLWERFLQSRRSSRG